MNTVTIYSYVANTTRNFDFATQREAINSFITRCDELGYDYYETSTGMEAGGIGHDLLITVTFNK